MCFNGEKKNNNALIKNKNACVMREDENKGEKMRFQRRMFLFWREKNKG